MGDVGGVVYDVTFPMISDVRQCHSSVYSVGVRSGSWCGMNVLMGKWRNPGNQDQDSRRPHCLCGCPCVLDITGYSSTQTGSCFAITMQNAGD